MVQVTDVAGAQPAVRREHLGRCRRVLEDAGHHARPRTWSSPATPAGSSWPASPTHPDLETTGRPRIRRPSPTGRERAQKMTLRLPSPPCPRGAGGRTVLRTSDGSPARAWRRRCSNTKRTWASASGPGGPRSAPRSWAIRGRHQVDDVQRKRTGPARTWCVEARRMTTRRRRRAWTRAWCSARTVVEGEHAERLVVGMNVNRSACAPRWRSRRARCGVRAGPAVGVAVRPRGVGENGLVIGIEGGQGVPAGAEAASTDAGARTDRHHGDTACPSARWTKRVASPANTAAASECASE